MPNRKMYFKMVLSSIFRRRSRMLVAILAICIGATILSGLVTIYYDIPRQLGKEFRSYGANLVIVPESDQKISSEDFEACKLAIGTDKIVGMAPYRYQTTKINQQPYILAGTDLEQAKSNSPFWFIEGSWPTKKEPKKVMVGKEIAKTLNLSIGDKFTADGVKVGKKAIASSQNASAEENKKREVGEQYFSQRFEVVAIVTTGGAEEAFIFLDIDELNRLIESKNVCDMIECSVEAEKAELDLISENINDDIPNIIARPVRRVTQSQDTVLGKLQALVYIVTIVVLIITMISVSTTMMAMVAERRQEIGLKKALGAENKLIIKEFIGEGAALGVIGGSLGVLLGFEFAQRVSLNVFGRAITFQWGLIPVTIIMSVLITTLASIGPVRKVLDIHPAIVLRGE